MGVQYNGYENHGAFYSDMSAILAANSTKQSGYFAIPHLILQSFDDPISTWRTNAANDPTSFLFSEDIVYQDNSSNLVVLLTKSGGHVGWPTGYFPHSWEYMNTLVAAGFISSYADSIQASEIDGSLSMSDDDKSKHHGCQVATRRNATAALPADRLLPHVSLDRSCF